MNTIKQAGKALLTTSFLCAGLAMAQSTAPAVPVAGTAKLGVVVAEMEAVIAGWSVKNDMLRKPVYNDTKDRIGTISDIIVAPNANASLPAATFAIIGVGGFLGIAKHDVAIPMEQLRLRGGRLELAGATKEALKALPEFKYRNK